MAALEVTLFGRLRVKHDGQELTGFEGAKVQELLAYLLFYPTRHRREQLAGLLWNESADAQHRKYLRQAIWQLQTALEPCSAAGLRPLMVEADWIEFNDGADALVDVAQFERAFALTQGVPGKDLDADGLGLLQSAVALYDGDVLAGCYQDWCLFERERLQNMLLAMLDKLMSACEAHAQYEMGLTYGTRILRYDRARERTHRRLMEMHWRTGDRTAALRQYERCRAALQEELGVEPSWRTTALRDQIRADWPEASVRAATPHGRAEPSRAAALPDILTHVQALQSLLAALERRVRADIAAIDVRPHPRR